MENIAVIGGMYGDEGKGLTTDYICDQMLSKGNGLAVVRFQGGAQSGHTVVTPEGKSHVYSHFGSGTHMGVPTILSSKFVCNPILFLKEYKELYRIQPIVYVDPECYITTPYDVLFNRALEKSRGDKRHGSVGVGFGETIEREEVGKISLRYKDLHLSSSELKKKLLDIEDYYYDRCNRLCIDRTRIISDYKRIYDIPDSLKKFKALTYSFTKLFANNHIFEGGQGLGLDMKYGEFPYVTRSRTGVNHALEFCSDYNIKLDGVIYLTRSYATRHGAGPLRNEDSKLALYILDETNTPNQYQGFLRFAPLDYDLFTRLTAMDQMYNSYEGVVLYFMTWVDNITSESEVFMGDCMMKFSKEDYLEFVKQTFDLYSTGPTRNDIIDNRR